MVREADPRSGAAADAADAHHGPARRRRRGHRTGRCLAARPGARPHRPVPRTGRGRSPAAHERDARTRAHGPHGGAGADRACRLPQRQCRTVRRDAARRAPARSPTRDAAVHEAQTQPSQHHRHPQDDAQVHGDRWNADRPGLHQAASEPPGPGAAVRRVGIGFGLLRFHDAARAGDEESVQEDQGVRIRQRDGGRHRAHLRRRRRRRGGAARPHRRAGACAAGNLEQRLRHRLRRVRRA